MLEVARPRPSLPQSHFIRFASSSSTRWLARQGRDQYTRASKLSALKSRAAYKLLEIDHKHHLFKPGQTVVDLGYAPGSWSQVAISRVRPDGTRSGRVIGIDIIPAQPPRGVSTIQGDFLSPATRQMVLDYVRDDTAGLPSVREAIESRYEHEEDITTLSSEDKTTYNTQDNGTADGRVADVVLSDM